MFRIIRRSPWIALGAAGALLLDPDRGPQRRAQLTSKARRWVRDLSGSTGSTPPSGAEPWKDDAPMRPSIDPSRVSSRADELLPEETAAGVGGSASGRLADSVLTESEHRTVDRPGTTAETRRSQETISPISTPSSAR